MTESPSWSLKRADPGVLHLSGRFSFDTAAAVSREVESALLGVPAGQSCELHLSGVEQADSAGLAVLVEALSLARSQGLTLRLYDVPGALRAIARISELDELLVRASEGAELLTELATPVD